MALNHFVFKSQKCQCRPTANRERQVDAPTGDMFLLADVCQTERNKIRLSALQSSYTCSSLLKSMTPWYPCAILSHYVRLINGFVFVRGLVCFAALFASKQTETTYSLVGTKKHWQTMNALDLSARLPFLR